MEPTVYVKNKVERVAQSEADAVKLAFDGYRPKGKATPKNSTVAEREAGAPKGPKAG